ncbi:unnamed protein product [Closterium sp. NIES-54]
MTIAVAIVALAVVSPLPFLPGSHAAKVKASQWPVLQVLKREWGGFDGSATWSSGANCENGGMAGIACTAFGDIIAMDLTSKGLRGSIPTSIGTLPELQFLQLVSLPQAACVPPPGSLCPSPRQLVSLPQAACVPPPGSLCPSHPFTSIHPLPPESPVSSSHQLSSASALSPAPPAPLPSLLHLLHLLH